MKFSFFQTLEYTFKSRCSHEDVVSALSENVMKEDVITIDFISEYADEKMGMMRHFEGYVYDNKFKINHKVYTGNGLFRLGWVVVPKIEGFFAPKEDGVEINIVFSAPNKWLIISVALLPYLILIVLFLFNKIVVQELIIGALLSTAVFFFNLVIASHNYDRWLKSDVEKLQSIFESE